MIIWEMKYIFESYRECGCSHELLITVPPARNNFLGVTFI